MILNNKHLAWMIGILMAFTACEKAEKSMQLPPRPLDSVALVQVTLGEHSEDQVYVNFLDSNYVKSSVKNSCWDLAFDCAPETNRIFMNGGKGVFIGILGKGDFLKDVNLNKVNWRWDEASGGDSIVLKNWCNQQTRHSLDSIYIIDRGADVDLDKRYYQFRISLGSFGVYEIEVADLKGKKLYQTYVNKDLHKNLVYFDFVQGKVLNFEPEVLDWQFCFLKCRWVYYEFNPPLIYTVTGLHINSRILSVAVDSTLNFDEISLKNIPLMKFSSRRDVIGFDWKIYDFGSGRYQTRKYVTYIIRSKIFPGKFYKLRFTDYYNKQGIKGTPKFEVAEIK